MSAYVTHLVNTYTAQKMKFSIKDFFTEEILNGKLHFLCSVNQMQ